MRIEQVCLEERQRINSLLNDFSGGRAVMGSVEKHDFPRLTYIMDSLQAIRTLPLYNEAGEISGFRTTISILDAGFISGGHSQHLVEVIEVKHGLHQMHIVMTPYGDDYHVELSSARGDEIAENWNDYVEKNRADIELRRAQARRAALEMIKTDF